MKNLALVTTVLAIAALALMAVSATAEEEKPSRGQQVFEDQKCNLCHAVSTVGIEAKTTSEKMKASDLVNLAEEFEADWIVKYLKKEAEMEGKAHTRPFKGSDEELQALVDWLLEQKAEG